MLKNSSVSRVEGRGFVAKFRAFEPVKLFRAVGLQAIARPRFGKIRFFFFFFSFPSVSLLRAVFFLHVICFKFSTKNAVQLVFRVGTFFSFFFRIGNVSRARERHVKKIYENIYVSLFFFFFDKNKVRFDRMTRLFDILDFFWNFEPEKKKYSNAERIFLFPCLPPKKNCSIPFVNPWGKKRRGNYGRNSVDTRAFAVTRGWNRVLEIVRNESRVSEPREREFEWIRVHWRIGRDVYE